jgi:DNA-binding transcriptional LysR family regulator
MITMSNQLEIRHLKYFLAVAEVLHFRKAADQLFISQPGLSRQIKQMEAEIGVKLFERNNKKVSLTNAGLYLKKEIVLTLKNLDYVIEHAKLLHEGSEGKIRFGYVGSAAQNVIPDILIRFKEKYSNIHFSLTEMDNPKQIEYLLSHDIDLGFVRLNKVPYGLNIHPIFEDTFSLVLPENHAINGKNFSNLAQLKNESFILFEQSYSPTYYEQVIKLFENAGFIPKISHYTVHASTIYKLVENNLGISIVPTALISGYDMDVKFIELKKIPDRTVLSVVWSKNNRNPLLKNILDLIL